MRACKRSLKENWHNDISSSISLVVTRYSAVFSCLIKNSAAVFAPKTAEVLADIAQYALPVVQRAYTLAEARRSVRELRGLLHAVLNAQEEERQRIVSEWHHQIEERLFRVFQDFHGFRNSSCNMPRRVVSALASLPLNWIRFPCSSVSLPMGCYRRCSKTSAWFRALRAYVTDLQEQEPFEVVMQADDGDRPLPTQTSRTLFRITQEALHNVQRHAKANLYRLP